MRKLLLTQHSFLLLISIGFISVAAPLEAQQNNPFTVVEKVTAKSQKMADKNSIQYRVTENDAEKYTIEIQLGYDVPFPALKVFADGSSVLINAFDATLIFYDTRGRQLLKSPLVKEADVEYERTIYSAVSAEYLAVVLSQPGQDYLLVRLYNSGGQFIREFPVAEAHLNGIFYSAAANLLALSVYNWTGAQLNKAVHYFNSDGERLASIPFNFLQGSLSENEHIFTGYTAADCFVYDINTEQVTFHTTSSIDAIIMAADFIGEEIVVVQAGKPVLREGKWFYANPSFARYDLSGRLISRVIKESPPFADYRLYLKDSGLIFKTEKTEWRIAD